MIDPSDWTKSDHAEMRKALDSLSDEQIDSLDDAMIDGGGYTTIWASRHAAHWLYCEAVNRGWILGPA